MKSIQGFVSFHLEHEELFRGKQAQSAQRNDIILNEVKDLGITPEKILRCARDKT